MKQTPPVLWFILVGVLALLGTEANRLNKTPGETATVAGNNSEKLRDYAATLKGNQLYAKAAEAYDDYVRQAPISEAEKAKVDFNTGNMLLDDVGDAEGALAHFLRVTEFYREVDHDIVKEARKRSAECMEKLGRSGAAERQLVATSQLGVSEASATEKVAEGEVLAKIGDRVSVTRTDFDEAWNQIPPSIREQQLGGPDGKSRLLEELVASRLFAEAARRKGIDRDPEIRRQVRQVEESLLGRKLMEIEVAAKVQIPASDLDLFYKAHPLHYTEPATVEAAHLLTSDATQMAAAKAAIESGSSFEQAVAEFSEDTATRGKGGLLGILRENRPPLDPPADFDSLDITIPGLGRNPDWVRAVFAAEPGEVIGPIQTDKGLSLVQVLKKTPATPLGFEQAKPQVEAELRRQREQEKQAELVAELMKAQKVSVYKDRLD